MKLYIKALHKLRFNKPLLKIIFPIARKIFVKKETMSVEEAAKIISDVRPNVCGSCYTDRIIDDEMLDLDIIVPCYNVSETVNRCIDSILNSKTKYNFRVIAVNDGSEDDTYEIIKEYKKHSNVLIINQKNKGLSGARNSGLNVCKSKYIMFVDSDDYIPDDAVENLLSVAERENAYIVQGACNLVKKGGKLKGKLNMKTGKLNPINDLSGFAWGKIYRRECFENLEFPLNALYEDSVMRQIIYPLMNKYGYCVYGIGNAVYNYYYSNPFNITHAAIKSYKSIDSLHITKVLFDDRKRFGLGLTQEYYNYIMLMVALTYSRTGNHSKKIQKAIFVLNRDFIMRNFNGMRTTEKVYTDLEKAVLECNFNMYRIIAALI